MVDPGAAPGELLVWHGKIPGNLSGRGLHTVAQTHGVHGCACQGNQGKDRHRVGIVENQSAWAESLGVSQDVEPGRTRAQSLEDPAGSNGISDTLVDAVLQGNVKVEANVG